MNSTKKRVIKAPNCISEDGEHSYEEIDSPWAYQCENCFERFAIISETVLKGLNVNIEART